MRLQIQNERYIISLLYSYFSQSLSQNSYSAPCSLVSTRGRFWHKPRWSRNEHRISI